MPQEKTKLHRRIDDGKPILIAEMTPPPGCDPEAIRALSKRYSGKVHALGISDNRDRVCLSALAAASLVVSEGLEPVLHTVTRDRNRIALISDCLGAQALGIRNILCTTGNHQTLGQYRSAKNVFDIDSTQLIQTLNGLETDGSLVGEEGFAIQGPFCLGGTVSPFSDPVELQILRLKKKSLAGAKFLITQPIFDIERFDHWWKEVVRGGSHEKVAILAGIRILTDAEMAEAYTAKRPAPQVPETIVDRIRSKENPSDQRAEGFAIALETIKRLSAMSGLRGFEIYGGGDDDAVLEVIEKAGLGVN